MVDGSKAAIQLVLKNATQARYKSISCSYTPVSSQRGLLPEVTITFLAIDTSSSFIKLLLHCSVLPSGSYPPSSWLLV